MTIYHDAGLVRRSSLDFHSNQTCCADMRCSTGDCVADGSPTSGLIAYLVVWVPHEL